VTRSCLRGFPGGRRTGALRPISSGGTAEPAALTSWSLVDQLPAARARFLSAAGHLVDSRPGAPFGFRLRVTDCPRDGFLTAMDLSCWSLLDLTRRAEQLMTSGGTIFAMSYHGANEVIENYGIMGPVKAALESAVRYLAAELGPKGIRVHAISPGPLATRAASRIPDFDALMERVGSVRRRGVW
jgi:NAD(P)-dependent dehydrogenase (short-subunit alcohol dehydrogenase family)